MSEFKSFWSRLRAKNPGLNDDNSKMTISVASFKKALEQAYNTGQSDSKDSMESSLDWLEKIIGR